MLSQFIIKSMTTSNTPITTSNTPTPPFNSSRSNTNKLTNIINNKKLYTQALKINIKDILHIKDTFPTLSSNKIIDINNIINK